jgi:hypothetical protein
VGLPFDVSFLINLQGQQVPEKLDGFLGRTCRPAISRCKRAPVGAAPTCSPSVSIHSYYQEIVSMMVEALDEAPKLRQYLPRHIEARV